MPVRLNPDQAAAVMRDAGLLPLVDYPGAGQPWKCRCSRCGREVMPRYTDVRRGHGGCRPCAAQAGAANLRMDHDTAAATMIKNGLQPLEPYPGSTRPWRCQCVRCGAEVTPRHGNIKQGWGGCRTCWRKDSSVRQRGPDNEAVETMQAAGFEPLEPYRNVMTPWRSQCRACGREVSPLLNNVRRGKSRCKWCSNRVIDPEAAAEFMRRAGLDPLVAYPGKAAPWPCRCKKCHRNVSPRYGAVKKRYGLSFLQRHSYQTRCGSKPNAGSQPGTIGSIPGLNPSVEMPLYSMRSNRPPLLQHRPAGMGRMPMVPQLRVQV